MENQQQNSVINYCLKILVKIFVTAFAICAVLAMCCSFSKVSKVVNRNISANSIHSFHIEEILGQKYICFSGISTEIPSETISVKVALYDISSYANYYICHIDCQQKDMYFLVSRAAYGGAEFKKLSDNQIQLLEHDNLDWVAIR